MLYSQAHNFVFVAVPKTGTTAIQKRLRAIDPDLRRNEVPTEDGGWAKMSTHASALQIRQAMGARADGVTFLAFLRDPYDVLISKYHFYRKGRAARKQGLAAGIEGEPTRFSPARAARVLFAQALPLPIWARLYPYSPSAQYVTDKAGALIVDKIGRMEHLQADMTEIFTSLGYRAEDLALDQANRTEYDRGRARDPKIEAILARRMPQDCALFERLRGGEGL